jgi:hypothetical protein
LVINFINTRAGDVSIPAPPASPPPFVNVNGDQIIAPLDALLVINFLNFPEQGEGERSAADRRQEQTIEGVQAMSPASSVADLPRRIPSATNRRHSDSSLPRVEREALELALDEMMRKEAWWLTHPVR